MTIDHFFGRQYSEEYNCASFACDVWEHLTGVDITIAMDGFLKPITDRSATMDIRKGFVRLKCPQSPCLVAMHRPRTPPHVGVYFEGRVLHIQENGVAYQSIDIASFGFTKVRFYKCP